MENQSTAPKYPLLEELLALRQMTLQATYTIREVATLFDVTTRAIQTRVASGQLASRDLPGRAKFLPTDLEEFLQNSRRNRRQDLPEASRSCPMSRSSTLTGVAVRDLPKRSE